MKTILVLLTVVLFFTLGRDLEWHSFVNSLNLVEKQRVQAQLADALEGNFPTEGLIWEGIEGREDGRVTEAMREYLEIEQFQVDLLFDYLKKRMTFRDKGKAFIDLCSVGGIKESSSPESSNQCKRQSISLFIRTKILPQIEVDDKEVRAFSNRLQTQGKQPEKVLVRQIVLSNERQARRIRYLLSRKNFQELAKKHSMTPESENGGLLPSYSKGQLPAVFDYAFSLKVGETSPILKSPYGFHILRLEQRISAGHTSSPPDHAKIVMEIKHQRAEQEVMAWLESALKAERMKKEE